MKTRLVALILLALSGCAQPRENSSTFTVENSTLLRSEGAIHWAQSRAALAEKGKLILLTQQIDERQLHSYGDIFELQSTDNGKTWSNPERIESLRRAKIEPNVERVIGDISPAWYSRTNTILATGKVFGFRAGKEDKSMEQVAYAVRTSGTWSELRILQMPPTDHAGQPILQPNAGCTQRVDLANGDILLPVRYRRDPTGPYVPTVARCAFDGRDLKYLDHGSEITINRDRGLYEPSLIHFANHFYLTLRADDSAFVAESTDGLHFANPREWRFDDGAILGSYNSQAHWLVHAGNLFLIYTRRGLNNDNVFRHRAPLVMAQIDPDRLCVFRSTERMIMPQEGLDLVGGFGILNLGQQTFVVSSEMNFPKERSADPNRVLLARIKWKHQ